MLHLILSSGCTCVSRLLHLIEPLRVHSCSMSPFERSSVRQHRKMRVPSTGRFFPLTGNSRSAPQLCAHNVTASNQAHLISTLQYTYLTLVHACTACMIESTCSIHALLIRPFPLKNASQLIANYFSYLKQKSRLDLLQLAVSHLALASCSQKCP